MKESVRERARASDWVWTLYPPVVFGLLGLLVANRWIAMGRLYSAEDDWYPVFRKVVIPWFCTIPPLVVPLFVALRFWRFRGLTDCVAPGGTFFRNRPWWTMTRTSLVFYGELVLLLLGGLLAGVMLNRPPWLDTEIVSVFAMATGLGLLTTAMGVGVTIPTWIMFVRMLRDRIGSIWCLAFVFVSTTIFTWMVSVGGHLWGFLDTIPLFITFGALNIPLLFIVPARFGDSPAWRDTLRLGGRREWSRDQVHFLLGIVYLTLLVGLVIIVSLRVWPSYLPMFDWQDAGLPWITEKVMNLHSTTAAIIPSLIISYVGVAFLMVYKEIRMRPGKMKSQINMVVALIAPTLAVAYLWVTYMAISVFFNSYVAGFLHGR